MRTFASLVKRSPSSPPRPRAAVVRRSPSPAPSWEFGKIAIGAASGLTVGRADDPLEHEADRVADRVMRMSSDQAHEPGGCGCAACAGRASATRIMRKGAYGGACQSAPDEQQPQAAGQNPDEASPNAMAKAVPGGAPAGPAPLPSAGGGGPLPAAALGFMQTRFGQDFGGVRIHADGEADALSRALSAEAFTLGTHIYFRDGRFRPDTDPGRRLLAHELAHVVQQDQGRARRTLQRFTLDGFPAAEAAAMRTAIPIASSTMRSCSTHTFNNRIAAKVDDSTYHYDTETNLCAHTRHNPWADIYVGKSAFSMDACCKLESTLAHEASHDWGYTEGYARTLECDCFSCCV